MKRCSCSAELHSKNVTGKCRACLSATQRAVPRPAREKSNAPKIAEIKSVVCAHFTTPDSAMTTQRRMYFLPRQVAMHLCVQMTPRTLQEIGCKFGDRDHSTVIHATRRIEELMAKDADLASDVAAISASIARRVTARDMPCGDGVSGD